MTVLISEYHEYLNSNTGVKSAQQSQELVSRDI